MSSDSPDPTLRFPNADTREGDAPLQAAYQAATRSDRTDCPQPEELLRMATMELDGDAKKRVVLHLAGCADCSSELRALRQAEADAGGDARSLSPTPFPNPESAKSIGRTLDPATSRGTAGRWQRPVIWAAAAAALFVLSIPVWRAQTPVGSGAVRDAGSATSRPTGTVADVPSTLEWPSQLGATAYVPKLYSAAAELVWTGPATSETSVSLPGEIVERLRAAGNESFVWTVDVRGAAAARTELGPFWFHVRTDDGSSSGADPGDA